MSGTDGLTPGLAAFNAGRFAYAAEAFGPAARSGDPRAVVFLAHALAALKRGPRALSLLAAAARRHPRDVGLRVARADMLRAAGRHEEALAAYLRAAALPAGATLGWRGAGACLSALRRWDESAAAWRKALAADSKDAVARAGLAEVLFAAGDVAQAAGHVALLERPRPGLLAATVRALAVSGRHAEARRVLARARRAAPSDPGPQRLMGEMLSIGPRRKAAAAWLARAAAPGPEPSVDRYAAMVLLGRGRKAAAEGRRLAAVAKCQADYDQLFNPMALTLSWRAPRGLSERLGRADGADPWPAMFRLSLNSMGGVPADAAPHGRRLRELAGSAPWMRYLCGHLELQTTGDTALAESDFRAALAAAPAMWKAEAYVAEMALCRGRTREAWERMSRLTGRLLGAERADARAWYGAMLLWMGRAREAQRELVAAASGGAQFGRGWLGAARVLAGRPREGLADLDATLRGKAPEEEALVWRAEAWSALGNYGRARADLAAALKVNPRSDWARLVLCRLDWEAGRPEAAAGRLSGVRPGLLARLRLTGAGLTGPALARAFRLARGLRRSAAYLDALLP